MRYHYSVFGLLFRSNLPLADVTPVNAIVRAPDIDLHLGIPPYPQRESSPECEELTYASTYITETGLPALRVWRVTKGGFLHIAYADGTEFWLDRNCGNLWATWSVTSSLEGASLYLLGPVLGFLLRLRGITCLHASAVAVEGCSVAFVGAEGSGKSTTAAAFAGLGYGVLSDDIVTLVEQEGSFVVMPAYPYLCLWPESVKVLYGSSEALPRFSQEWDKRRLALGDQGPRFENRPLSLGAIYMLGERRPDPAPYLEALRPQNALLSLVAETYANKAIDLEMRAKEFAVLGRLVIAVPIRRVYPHNDSSRLEELCKVIREDFQSLQFSKPVVP